MEPRHRIRYGGFGSGFGAGQAQPRMIVQSCRKRPRETYVRKKDITAAVAARLVASQFPRWAGLPIRPVAADGWDNTTFRLGEELLVRLPSHKIYAPQVDKEHRWLPVLAPQLALSIPEPVALGAPDGDFPRPWSVYRWIKGQTAATGTIESLSEFAAGVAGFLAALQGIDAAGGPKAGEHNFFRGGPLGTYDRDTRQAIDRLRGDLDTDAATALWDAALCSAWDEPPVWVHGDMAPSNLLVEHGVLTAVIDFGCAAIGDPACDLVMAWTFFANESAEAFRRQLELDDATWMRARGWALWKALITLAQGKREGTSAAAAAHRAGWRRNPREVIEVLLAEHRQET